jgi:hypothetical protein
MSELGQKIKHEKKKEITEVVATQFECLKLRYDIHG